MTLEHRLFVDGGVTAATNAGSLRAHVPETALRDEPVITLTSLRSMSSRIQPEIGLRRQGPVRLFDAELTAEMWTCGRMN